MSQKKRFFLRRFKHIFLIILLPSLILYLVTIIWSGKTIDTELKRNGRQSVESVEENLQLVMDSVFTQNTYLANMTRMSLALKRAVYGESLDYGNVIYMRSLQSLFMSITNAYDYIDTALIYYQGGDRYISSNNSIHILEGTADESWYELYQSMPENQISAIFLRTISADTAAESQVVTICQRLMLHDGCLVIDLNVKELQNMLSTFITVPKQCIYLLDENGQILVSSSAEHDSIFNITEWITKHGGMNQFANQKESFWTSHFPRSNHLICQISQSSPTLYIVSAIPGSAFWSKITKELGLFILIILIDLIVVFFLAFNTTRQSFQHIHTILQMFDTAERGELVPNNTITVKDEYDIIMNNIVRMFLNTTYLNTQLKEKQYREENAELMALQLQINPHFLSNTLQTLDLEAQSLNSGGAMHRIIRSLSDILKYAMEPPRTPVTLRQELDYLKKYMNVQRYRFGDHFIVYYDVDDEILDFHVFRMMLQPILENSLLHGICHLDKNRGYINVNIHKIQEQIHINITDTGAGMSEEELKTLQDNLTNPDSKNIGLTNLNRRLALYYGPHCRLHIESEIKKGTSVSFQIPIVAPSALK